MVPQLLHQLAGKAIGKRDFVKAIARTLYNLKVTSYEQSVLRFCMLLEKVW